LTIEKSFNPISRSPNLHPIEFRSDTSSIYLLQDLSSDSLVSLIWGFIYRHPYSLAQHDFHLKIRFIYRLPVLLSRNFSKIMRTHIILTQDFDPFIIFA